MSGASEWQAAAAGEGILINFGSQHFGVINTSVNGAETAQHSTART